VQGPKVPSGKPAEPRKRYKVARIGCIGRSMSAWLWLTGGALIMASWRGGQPGGALAGLSFVGTAAAMTAAALATRVTEAPRRPISQQTVAAAGWTGRRVAVTTLAALAIVASPMTCAAGARGSAWPVIAGALLFCAGAAGIVAAFQSRGVSWHALRRRRRARAQQPDAEWTWDHPWNPDGERKSFRPYLRTRWMYLGRTSVLAGLLLLPVPHDGSAVSTILVAIRIALAAASAAWLLRTWWVLGMGHVGLGYLKFPVHPGERASFTLGVSEGGAAILDAEVVMRHYRESRDGTGPGSGLPLATAAIPASEPLPPAEFAPGVHRRVEFDVPRDAAGTAISSANPSYWAVEIRGRTRAGPYEERFLVPVYERPSAEVPATPA
jgi:hypothetical protein